ncbi:hypothetical protein ERM86_13695 [Clostridioides difficile]|nr:hypothetical protein [Clostridioides difficile]
MNNELNTEVEVMGASDVMVVSKGDMASVDMMDKLENPDSKFFCSIIDDGTRASKVKIYNAINSAEEQLTDHLNETLEIVDVVAHPIILTDMNTGESKECLRTVLIDKEGKGYQAVSEGIISSLQKIFIIVGRPSWVDEPVLIKPKQVTTSNKFKVTTLELIG